MTRIGPMFGDMTIREALLLTLREITCGNAEFRLLQVFAVLCPRYGPKWIMNKRQIPRAATAVDWLRAAALDDADAWRLLQEWHVITSYADDEEREAKELLLEQLEAVAERFTHIPVYQILMIAAALGGDDEPWKYPYDVEDSDVLAGLEEMMTLSHDQIRSASALMVEVFWDEELLGVPD